MNELLENVVLFMDSGGDVLWLILAATFVMWILMLDKALFVYYIFPRRTGKKLDAWLSRKDKSSWKAGHIRGRIGHEATVELGRGIPLIKTIIALCPLFGLLGTVTGMIHLFDVMAAVGTGNARQMAAGISMATMPTMAGMVAALSGIYIASVLEQKASREKHLFIDKLTRA